MNKNVSHVWNSDVLAKGQALGMLSSKTLVLASISLPI
jgi:hypothetical protein